MNNQAIIGLSILLCFIAFGIVAANYITPRLRAWSREDAIKALAAPHMFRFVGLAFLMPGVVSPTLSPAVANLDLQYRRHRRPPLCLLPRRGRRPATSWLAWRGILHSDADRAAAFGDA